VKLLVAIPTLSETLYIASRIYQLAGVKNANEEALKSAEEGKDFQIKGKVWICPVCGHTYIGEEPPEKCPVCGAPREKYVGF
jgi:rubrerythrin